MTILSLIIRWKYSDSCSGIRSGLIITAIDGFGGKLLRGFVYTI